MLPKSFKATKCKTSLKLTVARIKLLKNKREVQVRQIRREVAQLLEAGQEQTARIRVEHVIREEKTMAAYDLIELYCELIVARMPIIESQKGCPIDLKEAICSVVFASPRCADIPELMDIRKQFVAKYGKEFINSALEVRPDSGVNRLVVEKLSARAPDVESKIKILTSIAQEHNVNWDSQAFKEQLQKPNEDLLNGPSTFTSASRISVESSNMKSSPAPIQNNESNMKTFPDEAATDQPSFSSSSHPNIRTHTASGHLTSQPDSRASEVRREGGRVNNSYPRDDYISLNRKGWNMEFKDATAAAEAAAESAERASMAARAAAELASQGNISRQQSTGSPEYGSEADRPHELKSSKLKVERNAKDAVTKANDNANLYQGMKPEVQNRQEDEFVQGISRKESASRYDDFVSVRGSAGSPPSSGIHVKDDVAQENLSTDYRRAASSNYARSTFDEDSMWDSNTHIRENDVGDTSRTGIGEDIFGSSHKQHVSSGYSSVVFDEYNSDTEDNNASFGRNKGFDSFLTHQDEELSHCPPSTNVPRQHTNGSLFHNTSLKMHSETESQFDGHSETIGKVAVSAQFVDSSPAAFDDSDGISTEGEDEVDNSIQKEGMRSTILLHGGRNSGRSLFSEESAPNSFPDDWPPPGNDKGPRNSNDARVLYDSSTDEEEPQLLRSCKESETMNDLEMASASFGTKDSEFMDDSHGSEQGLNFGRLTGGLKHRGLHRPPYLRNSSANAPSSLKQASVDSSSVSEEPVVSHIEKPYASFNISGQETYGQDSHPKSYASKSRNSGVSIDSHSDDAEGLLSEQAVGSRGHRTVASRTSNNSAEGSHDIYEKHSASRKTYISEDLQISSEKAYNQGLLRKEYKDSSPKSPFTYKDPDGDTSPKTDKLIASTQTKKFVGPGVPDHKAYNQRPRVRAYRESRQMSYFDSDGDDLELEPHHAVGSIGNKDVKLSRRTRGQSSQGKNGGSAGFTGRADVSAPSGIESKPTEASSVPEPQKNYHRNIQRRGFSESSQSDQSVEKLPVGAVQIDTPRRRENQKSSQLDSRESIVPENNQNVKPSRENSFKNVAHVHPKLPDYDSLAAHFHSLRSNRN